MVGIPSTKFLPLGAVTLTSEATIWTPTSGKGFRLQTLVLASSASGNLTLRDSTAGTVLAIIPLTTAPLALSFGEYGLYSGAINRVLTGALSVAGTVSGTLMGGEE